MTGRKWPVTSWRPKIGHHSPQRRAIKACSASSAGTRVLWRGWADGFARVPHEIEAQSGGFHENICIFGAAVRIRADRGNRGRATRPFNEAGVTMGHWHLISKDVEANKKLFLGMGAKMFNAGGNPLMMFPGLYINLESRERKGRRRHPGFGGQPCRLHRQRTFRRGRQVEGRRRAGAAGHQQPAGPGLRRDAGRRAHRNSGRQDAVRADQERARPLLPAGK